MLLATLVLATSATARDAAPLPWQVALGLRVGQVERAIPRIDQVVLVPDAATYLDEIGRWSPAGRWPVLIEDDHLAPMFVRRDAPARLLRRAAVAAPPVSGADGRARIEAAVVSAWGGTPGADTLRTTFARHGYVPPGVVLASTGDRAWTAAVALAAGRGQPIAWLDGAWGTPNATLPPDRAADLRAAVHARVAGTGWSFGALGDEIETITVCRAVAARVELAPGPERRGAVSGRALEPPFAVTDVLGRHPNGDRYAVTGWIFGDEIRAAYTAMCSLFLTRDRATFVHGYPDGGSWTTFDPRPAAERLAARGFTTTVHTGRAAGARAWRTRLAAGLDTDVLFLNSKGHQSTFDLFDERVDCADIPILHAPVALQMVHSWSLVFPAERDTVGGRWLDHGVYASVGASHEPFLAAFIPPGELARRLLLHAPFLVSARHEPPHPLAAPWRINTIGDPLMLCPAPDEATAERAPAPPPPPGFVDLDDRVRTLLRDAVDDDDDDDDGAGFAEAIALLDLRGRDEIAAELWRAAAERGHAADAARAALGPLFRLRRRDAFLDAWRALRVRDAIATDMLWHLMDAHLARLDDEDALMQLQAAIRGPRVHVDLARIAPALVRTFGRPHLDAVIDRELRTDPRDDVRKGLERLRKN